MSRLDLFNDGGYRHDGRRPDELRSIVGRTSVIPHPASLDKGKGPAKDKVTYLPVTVASAKHADGSSYFEHGLTQVLVFVHGPREPAQRRDAHDAGMAGGAGTLAHVTGQSGPSNEFNIVEDLAPERATLSVEILTTPFGTMERKKRSRHDRRLQEFSASIRATFEPIVQTHLYPRSEIAIQIHILQQDGSVLACAINAVTLALVDAGVALQDLVTACTVAAIIGKSDPQAEDRDSSLPIVPMVDATLSEESDLPNLTMATLYRSSQVCLLTTESRMHEETFKRTVRTGLEACRVIGQELDAIAKVALLALASRRRNLVVDGFDEPHGMGNGTDMIDMSM